MRLGGRIITTPVCRNVWCNVYEARWKVRLRKLSDVHARGNGFNSPPTVKATASNFCNKGSFYRKKERDLSRVVLVELVGVERQRPGGINTMCIWDSAPMWRPQRLHFNFWDQASLLFINLTAATPCRADLHCRLFITCNVNRCLELEGKCTSWTSLRFIYVTSHSPTSSFILPEVIVTDKVNK